MSGFMSPRSHMSSLREQRQLVSANERQG